MQIAERIQQLRKAAGYSQEKLAELLHVSRQAVSKWESGATMPTLDNLVELSKLFNVGVNELLAAGTENGEIRDAAAVSTEGFCALIAGMQAQLKRLKREHVLSIVGMASIVLLAMLGGILLFNRQSDAVGQQIAALSGRIDSIQFTAAQGAKSIDTTTPWQAQDSLVADYSYSVAEYDPFTGQVTLHITATPRNYTEGMTAVFSAAAGMDIVEADGVLTAGRAFQCSITLPVNSEMRLSAGFQKDGETQTQLLETVYGLKERYQMTVWLTHNGSVTVNGGQWSISGEIMTHVTPTYDGQMNAQGYEKPTNWPVRGTMQLLVNGVPVQEQTVDLSACFTPEGTVDSGVYSECMFYNTFADPFTVPKGSDVEIRVSLTDNYGAVQTQTLELNA